jgi:D-alanine--(R)-lactate ligase
VPSPDRSVHGLLVLERERYDMIRLDVVLPVLIGKFGEDGAIQGLLELSGIPYVGCDIPSSALCMDKSLAYIVAGNAGIATPKHWVLTGDEKIDPDSLVYPVFVKPARSGSSFGVVCGQSLRQRVRIGRCGVGGFVIVVQSYVF